ncbi:MAG: hypothetical protein ACQERF_12020 [Actinomycetota bacterium]
MSELITWSQACVRAGSAEAARHEIRAGSFTRLRRGSYLIGSDSEPDPSTRHRLLIAATVPHLGSDPVIAVHSAALLHGIPLVVHVPDTVQIAEQRRSGGRSTGGVTRHSTVGPVPTTTSGGFTVTTAARTTVDLARCCGMQQGVVAADHVLRTGLATRREMDAIVEELGRAHGIKAARAAVGFADARSESPGESISRLLIHELGFEAPELQVEVIVKGRRYRSDFGWEDGALLGEFDGRAKYRAADGEGNPEEIVWREKQREDAIRSDGHRMVRWVWADLNHAQLNQILTNAGVPRAPEGKPRH